MMRWWLMGCAGLLCVACDDGAATSSGGGSSSAGEAEAGTSDPQPTTAPTGVDTQDSNSGNSDPTDPTADDSGSESSSSTTGEPGDTVVRFIALGDGGEGNDGQYGVADVVEQVCAERGCEFALYLGDNFYDVGVDSSMDVQFQDKFELPYADLDLPFYITLGNHDYGTLGNEWFKSQAQIDYSQFSDKWTLPNEWYAFEAAHVTFVSIDSAQLFWNHNVGDQSEFLQGVLAASDSQHTVVFAHHPYISNGRHGNAGNYEGVSFVPIVNGENIEDFVNDEVCGNVDVYFSGHDHNMQWHPTTCGTNFIVSGSAAKNTDFENRDNNPPVLYQDDQTPGFAWVEIDGSTMTMAWYDMNNAETPNYENSIELGGG